MRVKAVREAKVAVLQLGTPAAIPSFRTRVKGRRVRTGCALAAVVVAGEAPLSV